MVQLGKAQKKDRDIKNRADPGEVGSTMSYDSLGTISGV